MVSLHYCRRPLVATNHVIARQRCCLYVLGFPFVAKNNIRRLLCYQKLFSTVLLHYCGNVRLATKYIVAKQRLYTGLDAAKRRKKPFFGAEKMI